MAEERVVVTRLISPEDWKKLQLETLEAVGAEHYKLKIARPGHYPIKKGIAAEGRCKDEMKKVIEEERRKKGLEKVTIEDWFKYAMALGVERLVDGVLKREAKVVDFLTKWHPLLDTPLKKIDVLPIETAVEREKKMIENLRGLRALKGKA